MPRGDLAAVGRGGTATLETLRLLCKSHNLLYAEQVYGPEAMARYRRGERTTHIDSRGEPASEARPTG